MHKLLRQLKTDMEKISLKQEEKIELRTNLTKLMAAKPVRISDSTRLIGQPGASSWYHLFNHMNSRIKFASLAALILVVGSTYLIFSRSSQTTLPDTTRLAVAPISETSLNTDAPILDTQTMAADLLAQADDIVRAAREAVSTQTDNNTLISIGTAEALLAEAHRAYDNGDYDTANTLAGEAIDYAQNSNSTPDTAVSSATAVAPANTSVDTGSPTNVAAPASVPPTQNNTAPSTMPASGRISLTLITPPTTLIQNVSLMELRDAAQTAITSANNAYSAAKIVVETNATSHAAGYSILISAGNTISLAQADVRAGNYLPAITHAYIAINIANNAKATAERALSRTQINATLNGPTNAPGQPTVLPTVPQTTMTNNTSSSVPVVNIPNSGPGLPINTGNTNPISGYSSSTSSSTFTNLTPPSPANIIPRLQLP